MIAFKRTEAQSIVNIDIRNEQLISLSEAPAVLPRVRRGRKLHPSTLYRWAKDGRHGVKLETLQVGGTLCTSVEALQRFFLALTPSSTGVAGPVVHRRSTTQRTADVLTRAHREHSICLMAISIRRVITFTGR